MLDAIIASRFDLMLISIGLIGYFILVSSRNARVAKDNIYKKVDVTCEQSQVEEHSSVKLARIIASMELGVHSHIITAELDNFLETTPQHAFTLNEVQAILGFCSSTLSDKSLPDMLFEHVQTTEAWDIFNAFIHFYLQVGQLEQAR